MTRFVSMSNTQLCALLAIVVVAWASPARAQSCDIVVPTDQPTIQDGIDASVDTQTVCVEAGTYYETIDLQGKAIHLLGLDGPDATVIDAGGSGTVVSIVNGEGSDTIVDGFTVTNGYASTGGGFYLTGSSPTITNVIVTGNSASGNGGGVSLRFADATLTNVTVRENSSGDNGGGISTYIGTLELTDVFVEENETADDGGGIRTKQTTVTMTNVVSRNNVAGEHGGGIYLDGSTPYMENIAVDGNTAVNRAGGIYIYNTSSGWLNNVRIAGNETGIHGGGMYVYAATPTLTNLAVRGNAAGDAGGGIYVYSAPLVLNNVIVSENTAPNYGGGIHLMYGYAPTVLYSDCWGNSPDNYNGMTDPTGVNGNVSVDPQFLDVTPVAPEDWDLHLSLASSLIDAGDPALADPDGGTSDMGMYGGDAGGSWDRDFDGFYDWWQPGAYVPAYALDDRDCDDRDAAVHPGAGCDCPDADGDGHGDITCGGGRLRRHRRRHSPGRRRVLRRPRRRHLR